MDKELPLNQPPPSSSSPQFPDQTIINQAILNQSFSSSSPPSSSTPSPSPPPHQLIIDGSKQPLRLTKPEGNYIRALIHRYTHMTQNEFSIHIGMDRGLLSRYLSGTTPITDSALNKIVNGIKFHSNNQHYQYQAKWEIRIRIQPTKIGQHVPNADSTLVDETL
jgi:hypothetical protein